MPTTAKPTVFEAWNAVMADVRGVGKGGWNEQQKFKFRGVDAVMNAVGPALREHQVTIVPIGTAAEFERYDSQRGANMRGCTVTIDYRVYGPAGDFFDGQMIGESADSGDKGVTKAESVAYRQFLLQALCLPTDEPDPDAQAHEAVSAQKVLDPRIDVAYEALKVIATGTLPGSIDRDAGLATWAVDHADVADQVVLHGGRNITLGRLAKQLEEAKPEKVEATT